MSSPSPIVVSNAVVEFGTTAIALVRRIRITIEYERERIPLISQSAPLRIKTIKNVRFTMEKIYANNSNLVSYVNSNTPIDIIIYPEGKVAGKPKWTLSNSLLYSDSINIEGGAVIAEDIEGDAEDFDNTGTVS